MISGFFGVPGCGKTTWLCSIAQKQLRKMKKGKSRYKHVLTNFYCDGCERINIFDLGKYDIEYSLILLDEITLDVDSRKFKSFPEYLKEFFSLHRHVHCDIIYFMQDPSAVDKRIRDLTYDLWYVTKPVFPFFDRFSRAKRVYRQINVNEYTSELVLGYRFPDLLERFFSRTSKILYRPKYYKYFDSFDKDKLDGLPEFQYQSWR